MLHIDDEGLSPRNLSPVLLEITKGKNSGDEGQESSQVCILYLKRYRR